MCPALGGTALAPLHHAVEDDSDAALRLLVEHAVTRDRAPLATVLKWKTTDGLSLSELAEAFRARRCLNLLAEYTGGGGADKPARAPKTPRVG